MPIDLALTAHREETFRMALRLLLRKKTTGHLIVETGTARKIGNWAGDGQSTLVWDDFCQTNGGFLHTVDINPVPSEYRSLTKRAAFHTLDSVLFLRKFLQKPEIDLLYLDSMDADGRIDSPIHHLAELTACWNELRSGTIIMLDDCHGNAAGKDYCARAFLSQLGIQPLHSGYQTIWIKP